MNYRIIIIMSILLVFNRNIEASVPSRPLGANEECFTCGPSVSRLFLVTVQAGWDSLKNIAYYLQQYDNSPQEGLLGHDWHSPALSNSDSD